jgi:TRAP transporter 4TM/12TM fusion protein
MEERIKTNGDKVRRLAIYVLACALAGFHFYTSGFGTLSALDHRIVHWTLMFVLIFLIYPVKQKGGWVLDILLMAVCVVSGICLYLAWRDVSLTGVGARTPLEIVLAALTILVTLEATRRTCGLVLPITACVFLIYLFIGPYLPPSIGHHGYSLNRIATILYFGTEGIFGTAIGVSSTIIIVFIMFGSLLSVSGGGQVFIDLAFAFTGRYRGGAAKTAVISSALMGTVSGSPIANVVTTGTFTIPLMKRSGYQSHVAGAVEAVASTGGQIMPPIMGAAAFIMAEYLGVPYATIAWGAFIPALLYFFSIFLIVDLEAIKYNIMGIAKEELPDKKQTLKEGWLLLIPLVLLIILILAGRSVTFSVFYSNLLILILWVVRLKGRMRVFLKDLLRVCEDIAKSAAPVVAACACAGIVVGILQLTGLGLRLCSLIEVIAQNHLLLGLFFCMFVALIMGMGLPTTVLYIVLSTIAAPALINLGTEKLAAHMFVFYFGCMSSITPPVALAAFGAAPIANAGYAKIGFTAFRFGLAAFVIPYMFVYSPGLLFQGSALDITAVIVSSVIGAAALAYAIQNWLIVKTPAVVRLALAACALLLIKQGIITDVIGVGIFALCLAVQKYRSRRLHKP